MRRVRSKWETYFSKPFSASKRCVSVMDIFSQLVVATTGLGSVSFSMRRWDIRWTRAWAGGLAAGSAVIVDGTDEGGAGGDWIGCGGGAVARKRIRSYSREDWGDGNEEGTFFRWSDGEFLLCLIYCCLQFIQRFWVSGIEWFLRIINIQFAANNDAEPTTRCDTYHRWQSSDYIAFGLLWFIVGLEEQWDDQFLALIGIFTFYDEETEGLSMNWAHRERELFFQCSLVYQRSSETIEENGWAVLVSPRQPSYLIDNWANLCISLLNTWEKWMTFQWHRTLHRVGFHACFPDRL